MTTSTIAESAKASAPAPGEHVQTEAGWLVREVRQASPDPSCLFGLLADNAGYAGGARYSLSAEGDLTLRTETPLPDGSEEAAAAPAAAQDTLSLCLATGWPCTPRAYGRIAVQLEGRTWPMTAIVEQTSNELRVSVDLVTLEPAQFDDAILAAISLFLLRLSGSVRLARPVARTADEGVVFELEVVLPASAPESSLTHAFAALSTAAGLSRAECRALIDPALAGLFLLTK